MGSALAHMYQQVLWFQRLSIKVLQSDKLYYHQVLLYSDLMPPCLPTHFYLPFLPVTVFLPYFPIHLQNRIVYGSFWPVLMYLCCKVDFPIFKGPKITSIFTIFGLRTKGNTYSFSFTCFISVVKRRSFKIS